MSSPTDPHDHNSGGVSWQQAILSMGIALSIPTTLAALVGLGIYLDHRFGKSPLFLIIFSLIGLVALGNELYVLWKRFGQDK
ncbi:MAG TPA: AtpZ/AtpI family protein [Acidobacteriota bacterium]|nr:AtpZ/AtpI family protein [Acidobacteriota bacterium]